MMHNPRRLTSCTSVGLAALFFLATAASAEVVVESITPGTALARAGVKTGDVLESWTEGGANTSSFPITTPFSFENLRLEQAPRGPLQLHGRRHGKAISWIVEPGSWQAQVRPVLEQTEAQAYAALRREVAEGSFQKAFVRVDATARVFHKTGAWELECWWWLRGGALLADAGDFKGALEAYRKAETLARNRSARVTVGHAIGQLGEVTQDLEAAEKAYRSVLALYGEAASTSLGAARIYTQLGKIAWARGQLDKVGAPYAQALAITSNLAPRSFDLGKTLNDAGYLAHLQGNFKAAESHLERAHLLLSELAPFSNQFGTTLHYLSLLARSRGRLTAAEQYLKKALELAEALATTPQDLVVAYRYQALGELRRMQGDLAMAEEYIRRSLELQKSDTSGSLQLALTLTSLADCLDDGGRDDLAEPYYRRALEILKVLGNNYLSAHVLGNLATLLAERGQLEEASRHFQRVYQIYQGLTPGSVSIPWALQQLGLVAVERGELALAESHYLEALALLEAQAPRHIYRAICLTNLGDLARQRNRLGEAERYFRRALSMYNDSQASLFEEKVRHGLGLTLAQAGRLESAAAEFQKSVALLEEQVRRLGGSRHAEGSFRAQHRQIYDHALATELALGRPDQAFHLLERSRAQSLLAMLTERDLDFAADLPPEASAAQQDLEGRIRETWEPSAQAVLLEKREELARLREEQESLEARLRRASPRFSALHYPSPLNIDQVRSSLDPGTVLLAYNVADEQTDLFVVTPEAGLVDVVTLPIGSQELRQQVQGFLNLLIQRRDPHSPFFRPLTEAGRQLYDLLIAPAAPTIDGGTRLLIAPDGALHQLPFAALVRPTKDYLVTWRPLHTILSATLYAQLREERRRSGGSPPPTVQIAAFGDPLYPTWVGQQAIERAEPQARSAVRQGLFSWEPLPHTRREVESIAEFYPREKVLLHLGAEATEEAVRSLPPGLDIVHFAVHGHLDDRFPLNSALALTIPTPLDATHHNGLLQAWEIFDSVRLDADLVVLSACSTALGQERGGEGLVGLVHAFHYAGARSILASLWNVNDRVTSELMIAFHHHLLRGLSKDEALQAAQLDLLKGPIEVETVEGGRHQRADATAPYYWAAFRILGDR